jgi:cardiolipin synthase
MRWTFMGALSAAKHSVRIWTPYFVPDQPMIAALSTAALRDVGIDVLTPANGDHPTVQWAARAPTTGRCWSTVCASSNGLARSTTAS